MCRSFARKAMCSQYNCPWCVLSASSFWASSAIAIVIWIMLAAQQEQMRICGDIHGVDLNLAFQNSTPFWGHYLGGVHHSFPHKKWDQRSILRHARVVQYRWRNTSDLDRQVTNVLPSDVSQKIVAKSMGPAMKEKNYIFMGDFVDRGRRFQKVEGSKLIFGKITGSDPWI